MVFYIPCRLSSLCAFCATSLNGAALLLAIVHPDLAVTFLDFSLGIPPIPRTPQAVVDDENAE
jgi:hypothetical protein